MNLHRAMASPLFVEGDPTVHLFDANAANIWRDAAEWELPHRPSTRLSDICEDEEQEKDDARSIDSWQDIAETDEKVDPSGYYTMRDTGVPFRQDYREFYRAAARGDIDTLAQKLDLGVVIDKETSIGFTALVIAISEMQVAAVKILLELGADVNHRVNDLPPLAHAASRFESGPELLQLLIDHGANLNTVSKPDARNVLHCAVAVGTPETVEFLVRKGMDLEKKCRRGCTPLLVAARAGNMENAKVLLKLGAKLDAVSRNGGGPLIWSSCWENVEAVKFWLDQGVDIDARDDEGRTSLLLACHYGSLETVNVLLENGADSSISSTSTRNTSALMAAVSADHAEIIKALAAHGCDLNYKNRYGETALDIAIAERRLRAIPVLLELLGGEKYPTASASLQIALASGHGMVKSLMTTLSLVWPSVTPLEKFGERDWLEWVLNEGGNLVRPRATFMMLHVALEEQNVDMVMALGINGCDVNTHLESGHTPLTFAVGHRNLELIKTIMIFGADVNLPRAGRAGNTPLDDAITDMQDGSDTEVVDLLLTNGRCRINIGKDPANTAFSYILRNSELEGSEGLWTDLAVRMIDSTQNVNDDRCMMGCSLLHIATLRGSKKIIDLLLDKGADLEARDELGVTPLLMACQHAPKMIPYLVERGADINAKYRANAGALAAAASHGNVDSLRELVVNFKMDIEVKTEQGYTPLACALTWAQTDAAKYLISKGAELHWTTAPKDQTALHFAAKHNLYSIMEYLLREGVDANIKDKEGWTPLHEASALASPRLVRLLLNAGADIEAELPNKDRPLHVALINEQESTARLLINSGASLTARASKNRTPLHICAEYNLPLAALLLFEHGASTEDTDDESWTPLCCCGSQFAGFLIDNGANVNFKDKDDWSPLHQAVHNLDYKSAQVLLQAGADINVRTTDDGLSVMERARDIQDKEMRERFVCLLSRTMRRREIGVEEKLAREEKEMGEEERVEEVDMDMDMDIGEVGGKFEII